LLYENNNINLKNFLISQHWQENRYRLSIIQMIMEQNGIIFIAEHGFTTMMYPNPYCVRSQIFTEKWQL